MTATPNEQPRAVRSRTRIGSDDARAWVRKLRLGNPYAKAILMAIANYMNEDGSAYPGITTLHLDTDIAEDTIISRLRWCESIGAIALFKCWVDENGRRNHDGRGRTTSTEIRFLFDVDLETIELNAAGLTKPKVLRGAALASHEARAPSPRPDGELNDKNSPRPDGELNPASPAVAPEQPPTRADRIEELDKEDSPLPPKGGEMQRSDEFENRKATSWARFETAWQEPILRQSIGRQVWWALTEPEEEIAIKAALGYVIHRHSQKKPPNVINAHTFLRERDAWPGFVAIVPSEPAPSAPLTFEAEGSQAWQARRVIAAIAGEPEPSSRHVADHGYGLLTSKPLSQAKLALAQFAIEHDGQVDTREWVVAKQGANHCGAWREFLNIEARNVWSGETVRKEVGGKVYEHWKVMIMGLRVPTPFPPRKDGSLSGPDPPVCGE